MGVIAVEDVTIEVDEDGFIQEPNKWNENVARYLAQSEDVEELEDTHWRVINYLRDFYRQYGMAPPVRKLCKDVGIMTDFHGRPDSLDAAILDSIREQAAAAGFTLDQA